MNLTTLNPVMLILGVCLVLAIGIALWMYLQKKRTQKLRSKFGPEYDKAIGEHRDRGHAESELQKRAVRVAKFNIQPLKAEDRSQVYRRLAPGAVSICGRSSGRCESCRYSGPGRNATPRLSGGRL